MISIKNLKKAYPGVTPFSNVNVEIEKGEVISIIGPSGTGKSTLLRCLNLLEKPTEGEIWLEKENITARGVNVSAVRRKMGMVFQSFNLFSHLTVIENIMLGPVDLLKIPRQEAHEEGMKLLESVGLSEKALAYPDELSGGQQQRVAIVRALAMHPEILLFDEPTSALDPTMVGEVLSVIRTLAQAGMTMLIVTHEMKFARDVSTRVFYMDEGGIYEDGTPEQIFEKPKGEKTRIFVKRLKTFESEISSKKFDFLEINTLMEGFGRHQGLSPNRISAVQLVFEEICVQTLLPHFQDNFHLKFSVTTSELDASCEGMISYDGDPFNPFEDGQDELPIRVIRNFVKTHAYFYAEGVNHITFVIK
ncbi:MAG: amino acid ABC transporter ATP-binding protein [Christensenellaceae bacterium]